MTKHQTIAASGASTPTAAKTLFPGVDPDNFLFDTDSYKLSHHDQFPEGTEFMSYYIEPRRAWRSPTGDNQTGESFAPIDKVVFFGLQIELAKLRGPVVTAAMVDEAEPFLKAHGFSKFAAGWRRIVDVHGGRLPVRIDALDEGTVTPSGVPQVRIVNTDPMLGWLPGFLETRLLRAVWYPSTVASLSRHVIGEIRKRLMATDGSDAGVMFKLHDFGARGASSRETAMVGGLAHLVSSMGTDTTPALALAQRIYGAEMAGYSIPATEHSTVTVGGPEGELGVMERFLDANPSGVIACVSDSYDLMRAVRDYWGGALRDKVLARDGVLVVRPDSGDPITVVPEVIETLMERFGWTMTAQGYRLLNDKVRVIQGDGVDRDSIVAIMDALMARGLAIGNIAFGMGGGLLQKVTRDDFSYAMKASAICVKGSWRAMWKDPKTADGAKTSRKGRFGVSRSQAGNFEVLAMEDIPQGADLLRTVFLDGEVMKIHRFDEIRARAAA